jgi:hypothetical protein
MKKQLFWLLLVILVSACGGKKDEKLSTDLINNSVTADSKGAPENAPIIKFEMMEHDFGKVTQGEKLTYNFRFVNSGKTDLLISQASGSCGCTVAEFPQEPIKSGKEGAITVTLNTEGKKGPMNKTVTIFANSYPSETVLHIKAMVEIP